MVENAFLTEKRREVLNGESDLEGQSLANQKYRIRKRAKMALDELGEVARSMEIENRNVWDAEDVAKLVFWITHDSGNVENATKPDEEWDAAKTYTEEHRRYMRDVHFEITKQLNKIENPEEGF